MLFGLTNALAAFMHLMNRVFKLYLDWFFILFTYYILVYYKIMEEHEKQLRVVLKHFEKRSFMQSLRSVNSG